VVSQCANPSCRAPLRHLRDGRLFQFEVRTVGLRDLDIAGQSTQKLHPRREICHFWLCGQCSQAMTLTFDNVRGVVVTPLQPVNSSVGRPQPDL
jgi:hypothetical protein